MLAFDFVTHDRPPRCEVRRDVFPNTGVAS
jgi:hypothetical protein